HRTFLERAANPRDHRAGSLAVTGDVPNRLAHFLDVDISDGEHALDGLGVAHDRAKRLVDLVGDRRRQLARQGGTADADELMPQTARLLFGAAPGRHVDHEPLQRPWHTVLGNDVYDVVNPDGAPVRR